MKEKINKNEVQTTIHSDVVKKRHRYADADKKGRSPEALWADMMMDAKNDYDGDGANPEKTEEFFKAFRHEGKILMPNGEYKEAIVEAVNRNYLEFGGGYIQTVVLRALIDYAGNDSVKQDEFAKAFRNEGIILRTSTEAGDLNRK